MSLQGAIDQRMEMIRAEYPKVCQYLRKEMKIHLERLANEGKMIFQQLRRNRRIMVYIRKDLRRIYGKLKELCCKADVDLLQVRTEKGWQDSEHQFAWKSLISPKVSILFNLHFYSG